MCHVKVRHVGETESILGWGCGDLGPRPGPLLTSGGSFERVNLTTLGFIFFLKGPVQFCDKQ